MKILTAAQMQHIDRLTTEVVGVPSLILMENAGLGLCRALEARFPDLAGKSIAIFCGRGNNGGDGMVLARQLLQRGIQSEVFLLTSAAQVRGDAAVNLGILTAWGLPVFEVTSLESWQQAAGSLDVYDIIVDAMLGTGADKPLTGLYRRVVEDLNSSRAFVMSVDLPSGMPADSLESAPLAIRADLSVTFTAPKIAHVLSPDQESIGELEVVAIGTPPALMDRPELTLNLLEAADFCDLTAPRAACSHKGTYGHVGILAGSRGKSGAAALSALAALKTGAGLVTALTPEEVRGEVAAARAEIMTEGLPADRSGGFSKSALAPLLQGLARFDAIGAGPGLGTGDGARALVTGLVRNVARPLVLDADGLNLLAEDLRVLEDRPEAPLILTPHPGEFARLAGAGVPEVLRSQLELVPAFARHHGVWVVLKTFRPLIADPSGVCYVSPRGQAGMATAGMGDVLTGVLTALLGRIHATDAPNAATVTQAVTLGVFLHGLSGEHAAQALGEESLTAGDVIDFLSRGWHDLKAEWAL